MSERAARTVAWLLFAACVMGTLAIFAFGMALLAAG